MSWLLAVWSVFCFEWRRTLTFGRAIIWIGLVAFPPTIATLVRVSEALMERRLDSVIWDVVLAALTGVVGLLSLLLWATPIVSEERAANTWSYLAVRSCGVAAVTIGKYLNAISWAVVTAAAAATLSVAVALPPGALSLWWMLIALTVLGAPAYAAVFVLLGVAFERIAMGLSFVYALVLEVVVASAPVVVNQITVRYRLQTLLARWREWPLDGFEDVAPVDPGPAWQQMLIVLIVAAVVISVAVFITSIRELVKPDRG